MKTLWPISFILLLSACSHNQTAPEKETAGVKASAPPTPSIEAKELAAEEQAPYVTEFKFAKGKSALTRVDQVRLRKFLEEAKAHGKISDVKIISWSDMEYPSVHTRKLSKSQVALAAARADDIKNKIKDFAGDLKIEEFNMSERPGALAEWVGTVNSRIKKSLEVAGIPNTDTSVKVPAKSSKAMVLLMMRK